ncbi:MAG: hypothetical protein Q4G40_04985 [Brachybacterium sp.]|nr:hypothetical protein [Brachybacterium sp.]
MYTLFIVALVMMLSVMILRALSNNPDSFAANIPPGVLTGIEFTGIGLAAVYAIVEQRWVLIAVLGVLVALRFVQRR